MAKKLDSILSRVPPATVNNPVIQDVQRESESKPQEEKSYPKEEQIVRINAEVPMSVKIQMKERLFKNPYDTERTILLKALRAYGFDIDERYLVDNRKVRRL